jgi:hypothetical protein
MHSKIRPIYLKLLAELKSLPEASDKWDVFSNALQGIIIQLSNLEKICNQNHYEDLLSAEQSKLYALMDNPYCKNDELKELWATGSFFPGFPIIRRLDKMHFLMRTEAKCSKHSTGANILAPGVVLFYCMEHAKCIGFIVQRVAESPSLIFETLVSRFSVMPEVIIYDNACNLFEYCHNRMPNLFKSTRFLIDNFHFFSHINCAPTFDTHHHDHITRNMNTSLCEQKNKKFAKAKSICTFQRFRSFVAMFRFLAYKINEEEMYKEK